METWEPKHPLLRIAVDILTKTTSLILLPASFIFPFLGMAAFYYEDANIFLYWIGTVALVGGPVLFLWFCMTWLTHGGGRTGSRSVPLLFRGHITGVGRRYFSWRVTFGILGIATVGYLTVLVKFLEFTEHQWKPDANTEQSAPPD